MRKKYKSIDKLNKANKEEFNKMPEKEKSEIYCFLDKAMKNILFIKSAIVGSILLCISSLTTIISIYIKEQRISLIFITVFLLALLLITQSFNDNIRAEADLNKYVEKSINIFRNKIKLTDKITLEYESLGYEKKIMVKNLKMYLEEDIIIDKREASIAFIDNCIIGIINLLLVLSYVTEGDVLIKGALLLIPIKASILALRLIVQKKADYLQYEIDSIMENLLIDK